MPVIIDPALYMKTKGDLFWMPERRSLPTAFKLFTGACTALSVCPPVTVNLTSTEESLEFVFSASTQLPVALPICVFISIIIVVDWSTLHEN
jgi:hypothetical protein